MKNPIEVVRLRKIAEAKKLLASGALDQPTEEMLEKTAEAILKDVLDRDRAA